MPIEVISGPFCIELVEPYIAHETDTDANGVPIIREDGLGVLLPENAPFGMYGVVCGEGQPVCCNEPTIVKFFNQARTEIFYSASLRTKHGTYPSVLVYYYQATEEDGELIAGGYLTRVSWVGLPPTKIVVDHGGTATGIIKIV
jgi:hypothetical protein